MSADRLCVTCQLDLAPISRFAISIKSTRAILKLKPSHPLSFPAHSTKSPPHPTPFPTQILALVQQLLRTFLSPALKAFHMYEIQRLVPIPPWLEAGAHNPSAVSKRVPEVATAGSPLALNAAVDVVAGLVEEQNWGLQMAEYVEQ